MYADINDGLREAIASSSVAFLDGSFFSDDEMRVGELLKMEFFLADVPPVTYTAEVVWIDELPPDYTSLIEKGYDYLMYISAPDRFAVPSSSTSKTRWRRTSSAAASKART